MEAVRRNRFDIVKLLIEQGSNKHDYDTARWNMLHDCARDGYDDILEYLISLDSSKINCVNKYNETPLYYASRYGNLECVRVILSNLLMSMCNQMTKLTKIQQMMLRVFGIMHLIRRK